MPEDRRFVKTLQKVNPMSASITPLHSANIDAGDALMKQIAAQLQAMQQANTMPQATTQANSKDWLSFVEEPKTVSDSNDFVASTLVTVLLDSLFGFGLFSSMGQAAQGVAQMTAMEHATRGNQPNGQLQRTAMLNDELNKRAFAMNTSGQKKQTQQMKMLQQMMAMLLMNMLSNQSEDEGSDEGEGMVRAKKKQNDVVNDVLRHPTMARFKQNRQSIACIRTMFQRQADIVAPKFAAPRYAM